MASWSPGGEDEVYCTDCHRSRERYLFPHQPNPAETRQEFSADVSQQCQRCHDPIELHNPGHLMAEDADGLPTCTDCHGGHTVEPAETFAADPTAVCHSCHETYDDPDVERVHNELVANFGPDQSCQTCHNDAHVYPSDAKCKSCHTLMDGAITLASGETVGLNVDLAELDESVHGYHQIEDLQYTPLLCTDCHSDAEQYQFPHPAAGGR